MAVVIALSIILKFITIFKLPFGGSVTLAHTAPLILFAFVRGYRKGGVASLIYSFINAVMFFKILPGKSAVVTVLVIFIDYFLIYAFVGLAPLYSFKIKNLKLKIFVGSMCVGVIRFCIATFSGILFWQEYFLCEEWSVLYSMFYNGSYIIPETIITTVICCFFADYFVCFDS